jgi:hypothetical protein
MVVEFLKEVARVRADSSNQPTGVDGDGLGHVSSLPKTDEIPGLAPTRGRVM